MCVDGTKIFCFWHKVMFCVYMTKLKDNEGQTPLHYAAVCEREAKAELLVKKNAGKDIKDDDGNFPSDLCDPSWPLIQPELADNL